MQLVLFSCETLADYPNLADVKLETDKYYLTLDNARHNQEGGKGATKELSNLLDESRIAAMTGQYQDLGYLMNKYPSRTQLIAPFFDLETLRDNQQTVFTGTLDAQENEAVLVHTFAGDDELHLKITSGAGSITFYLATTTNGTDSMPITIVEGIGQTITASDFGITEYGTHRYLTAVNNGNAELHFEVELM